MKKEETHEAWGTATFSRSQGTETRLFGSSIRHQNTIVLEICTASVQRDLSQDWIHSNKHLIKIEMSPTQFAELISTMNVGCGSPVTIRYANGVRMQEPPIDDKMEQFDREIKKDVNDVLSFARNAISKVKVMINGKVTKGILNDIKDDLEALEMNLKSNMPFVLKQFQRQMYSTIKEAKGEIDAFVTNMIHKTGLEALRKQAPKIGYDNKGEDK